jgi:aminoglycoside phosphotransferase (APT) family kinase protein
MRSISSADTRATSDMKNITTRSSSSSKDPDSDGRSASGLIAPELENSAETKASPPLSDRQPLKSLGRFAKLLACDKKDTCIRDDHDGLRVDWRPMLEISDTTLREVVLKHIDPEAKVPLHCTDVLWRTNGAFHYIACVGVYQHNALTEYIVRIPGHGARASWTEQDAYNLEREVDTMKYTRYHTDVPVSEIYGHNSLCDNHLGMPYIMMACIGGKDAYSVWFDQPYDPQTAWKNADEPSEEMELKRIKFLRSLARIMSSLQRLQFDRIGYPLRGDDDDPSNTTRAAHPVGHSYHFLSSADPHKPTERPAFATTQQYIAHGMSTTFESDTQLSAYTRKIMEIVFSQPVFNPSNSHETFTLHHNDLDLQNILVDHDGNITGIIDWDGAYAAPRCIGASAVPKFLRNDWYPAYCNGLDKSPHMAWNTDHYRQIYAAALLEASPDHVDVQYTTKSAMYQAAIDAVFEDGNANDFVNKLLREIPGLRMSPQKIKAGLAEGWPAGEKMLQREIARIFAPEMPKAEYLLRGVGAGTGSLEALGPRKSFG